MTKCLQFLNAIKTVGFFVMQIVKGKYIGYAFLLLLVNFE